MFWNPQLEAIEELKERLKEAYVYYEVETETYENKRTRKFYKNYISRRQNDYNKSTTIAPVCKHDMGKHTCFTTF